MKAIHDWLNDPKRSMKAGVELFNAHASPEFKSRYGQFFTDNRNATAMTLPYNMLINKLTFIARNSGTHSLEHVAQPPASGVESGQPTSTTEQTHPTAAISLDALPDSLQPQAIRIKELVPIIARLTAEIADEALPTEQAQALCEELVACEAQKKALWEEIEQALNGGIEEPAGAAPTLSTPPTAHELIQKGVELAKLVKLLKEKIKRNNDAAMIAKSEQAKQKSLDKVTQYEAELSAVETQLSALHDPC